MILLAFVPFKVYNKSNFRGRLIHRKINKWDFLPPKIGVDLYTSSTYTPVRLIHQFDLYTGKYGRSLLAVGNGAF